LLLDLFLPLLQGQALSLRLGKELGPSGSGVPLTLLLQYVIYA
jgi:hypothetical protein